MHFSRTVLAILFATGPAVAVNEIVDLSYQRYRGQRLANGVTQWLGIQYAAPPIGELRFQPPQDPSSISGVQDAFQVFSQWYCGNDIGDRHMSDLVHLLSMAQCAFVQPKTPITTELLRTACISMSWLPQTPRTAPGFQSWCGFKAALSTQTRGRISTALG